jgi:hypothetical protein
MPNTTIYAALAAFLGALVALFIYNATVVGPSLKALRRLAAEHEDLIGGGGGGAASERLQRLESGLAVAQTTVERVSGRLDELEALAGSDVSCVGFVRYNAFEDTGSDLSYALALLNRAGDGVVINSIYSRVDTRTYGQSVKSFKPAANASEEELRAIELARTSSSSKA